MSDPDKTDVNGSVPARRAIVAGAPLQSIVPQSIDDVVRFANMAVMAGLVIIPKKKWQQGEDASPVADKEQLVAMATAIILQGLDVGLHPMQALQSIALINGRPLIWGDAVPALLWRAGFKLEERMEGEGDASVAHCRITRPEGTVIERSFSVADAKKARLWDTREKIERSGKNGKWMADNDSPWNRFPLRMLQMRARGFAVKDGASDVTRGLYIREEYDANDVVGDIDTPPQRATTRSGRPRRVAAVDTQTAAIAPEFVITQEYADEDYVHAVAPKKSTPPMVPDDE